MSDDIVFVSCLESLVTGVLEHMELLEFGTVGAVLFGGALLMVWLNRKRLSV